MLFLLLWMKLMGNPTIVAHPLVQTRMGMVQGLVDMSRSGRPFHSFKSIPYARPPLGSLRFRPPQPPEPWNDVLLAVNDGPPCIQKNYLFEKPRVEGSEDCLHLNVYTPEVYDKLLPVMVFINWGGFFTGYGGSDYLGPEYLMDKDIVLVTFNYRLGAFGFFSTNDDEAPGNYGLKDQRAALRWVQENIDSFGGDPRKVTIFGQSAGGASVHYHMLSHLSRKLFHRAICESGTALALWAKPLREEQLNIAKMQSTLVGCKDALNDSKSLVDCLRTVDAVDIVESGDKFKYFSVDPLTVYLPSIERRTESNPEPFLTKMPLDYILNGDFKKVPFIIGTVRDEGILRAAPLLSQSNTRTILNKQFNNLMPNLLALFMSSPNDKIQLIWKKIKDFYFDGKNSIDITNMASIQGLIDLYTDRSFAYTSYQTALLHSIKGHDTVWLYHFQYKGQYSYGDIFAATNENIDYKWGVSHNDELLYLFKTSALFPELQHPKDVEMSEKMVDLWTSFATFGYPNLHNHTWSKINRMKPKHDKSLVFLNISGHFSDDESIRVQMDRGLYEDRFQFWENLPLAENLNDLYQKHVEL